MESATQGESQEQQHPPTTSDRAVRATMHQGFEKIAIQTAGGLVLGGLMGIVVARSGSAGLRKGLAGFGAGIGLGSGWTRTSMDLEELLGGASPAPKK